MCKADLVLSSYKRISSSKSHSKSPCWDLQSSDERFVIIGDERDVLSIALLLSKTAMCHYITCNEVLCMESPRLGFNSS